jgi:hypothetical protein
VKLALYEDCDVDDYRQRIRDHYLSNLPMVGTAPCCARKVVEQALHYAQGSGFAPHPDYKEAHESLEDCELRSVLKSSPLVTRASLSIGGPRETEEQARRIVWHLQQRCGSGNFDYLIMLGEAADIDRFFEQ